MPFRHFRAVRRSAVIENIAPVASLIMRHKDQINLSNRENMEPE
jgi:hypothetical protein